MSVNLHDLAERFAALIVRFPGEQWQQLTELPSIDLLTMRMVVQEAGFDDCRVVPGNLRGSYRDEDGSATGETYPINGSCAFKVITAGDRDYIRATAWLDALIRRIIMRERFDMAGDKLIPALVREIERSRPLPPIRLSRDGDELWEYPPTGMGMVDHQRDHDVFHVCVHGYCGSWMDRKRATRELDQLICRGCYRSFRFPKGLSTYGDLRVYMSNRLTRASLVA